MTNPTDSAGPGPDEQPDPAPPHEAPQYPQYDPPQYQATQYQTPQYQAPEYQAPQYGQPQYGQPQYGQPQYGQPQYQAPQYQPIQYGQPQYGQPQYGQPPQHGQPGYQPPQYGQPDTLDAVPAGPARGRRTKVVLAASVAAIVIAGGLVSFVALRDKSSGAGASSPQGAVKSIVADLSKSDLLGVLDHLPPGERDALRDSFTDEVSQLKRLKVLNSSADPAKVNGVQITSTGLTFDPNDEVINDHVRIAKLTGGTITLNADASQVPYTKEFLDAAFPSGNAPSGKTTNTVDIAQEVAKSGHPARIAVQKVSGKWYPSLMYTILDAYTQDAGKAAPTASDAIAAVGAASPQDAARQIIDAALASDATKAIAILDPTDSAALHDYGKLLTDGSQPEDPSFTIDDISFNTTSVPGGTRVSLQSVAVTSVDDGTKATFAIDGDCIKVSSDSDSRRLCAADLFDNLDSSGVVTLTSDEEAALTDLLKSLPNIGIVTTQSNGKWYVSPIRTYSDLGPALLGGLADNDLITLIKLANKAR